MQHLSCRDPTFERPVQVQGLVEIPFGESELTAVGMEDSTIGEKPRFVQAVAGTAEQRKSSAAVLNCLFKATDADVNEGTLYKDLSAQFSRGLFGRVIELGQRRVRVSALEECEDQAQSRLGRAYVQLPGLGDGDRAA